MTQRDRDRLVALKQARKRQITQKQAAEQMQCTERHTRRLLKKLQSVGDQAVIHGLRGRESNRKRSQKERDKIIRISRRRSITASARRWLPNTWPASTRFTSAAKRYGS